MHRCRGVGFEFVRPSSAPARVHLADFAQRVAAVHLSAAGCSNAAHLRAGSVDVAPRDMVAAVLPDPAKLGPQMTGKICSGVLVTGRDKNGSSRATYLYNVVDNNETMAEYDAQCVVVQAAMGPVIALELIANGVWRGAGVLGAEAFDSTAYLDLMSSTTAYNQQWYAQERLSSAPLSSPTF